MMLSPWAGCSSATLCSHCPKHPQHKTFFYEASALTPAGHRSPWMAER